MKIKKGDTVLVIAGKDRGKSGAVLAAFPKKDRVVVAGVNLTKKHRRGTRSGQAGQIIERPTPVHVSNVALKDPKTAKQTRVGYLLADGKKVRIARGSKTKV